MFQQKNNQKVVCNMYNLAPILVSNFPLLLLPTGSPLMKLWQFWPFQSPPDHTKCYLTAKSSPQPSIHIFRKSQKKLATFPIDFFRGIAKVWEGGHFTPPPASDRVKERMPEESVSTGFYKLSSQAGPELDLISTIKWSPSSLKSSASSSWLRPGGSWTSSGQPRFGPEKMLS